MATNSRIWREGMRMGESCTFEGNLLEHIHTAQEQALLRHIEVNTAIIDYNMAIAQGLTPVTISGNLFQLPDMVMGLRVVYTRAELPLKSAFVLTKTTDLPLTKDEEIERLKAENDDLKEKLHRIYELTEGLHENE